MLERFSVSNFRGFEKEVVFDLRSGSYGFNQGVVYNGLVKNALVYGINGSGKSSLGIALFDISRILTDNAKIHDRYLLPYHNLNNASRIVKFKYEFQFGGSHVEYAYAKLSPDEIAEERVSVDGEVKLIASHRRKAMRVTFDGLESLQRPKLDGKLSLVKYIVSHTPTGSVPILEQLVDFANRMLWYRSLSYGNDYCGFMKGSNDIIAFLKERALIGELERFLKQCGLSYKLGFRPNDPDNVLYAVFRGGRMTPFYGIASTGTKALVLFFYWYHAAMEKASFVFIDEFDAFFHVGAAEAMAQRLNKTRNCQTVVTTHNVTLMTNAVTRPDSCYILRAGNILPLSMRTNRVLREAHNLEKMYMNGLFDA